MFSVVPYQVTTFIPPWFLDPRKGPRLIKGRFEELLSDAVLGYEPSLDGVLLAYGNVKLPKNAVTLVDYTPFGKANCYVKLLVLKLKPGQRLIGRVTFVGDDQISLQVFGVFPAVITVENGLSDYCIVNAGDPVHSVIVGKPEWRQETKEQQEKIGIGSWMRFELVRVQLGASERLFLLHGTLKETGDQTSTERLGLLDEDQVRESFQLPLSLSAKRKEKRPIHMMNTIERASNKEMDSFSFGYSSLGDPLVDVAAKPAVHQYFPQDSSDEEEDERETEQMSPLENVISYFSLKESTPDEKKKKKKKDDKKKKKHDKKKRKRKHKRDKKEEESSSEKSHKKKRRRGSP